MMWLKNKEKWDGLDLINQVEELRKHYCTGPCGQSSSVLDTRSAVDHVLKEVKKELTALKNLRKWADKWEPYIEAMPFSP